MESQSGQQGTRPAAAAVLGISPAAELSLLGSQMHTSNRSACHPCSNRVSVTSRTAVYGPVRTVVWEGRSCKAPPYPDLWGAEQISFMRWPMTVSGPRRSYSRDLPVCLYYSLKRDQNMGRALGCQQFLDRFRQESLGRKALRTDQTRRQRSKLARRHALSGARAAIARFGTELNSERGCNLSGDAKPPHSFGALLDIGPEVRLSPHRPGVAQNFGDQAHAAQRNCEALADNWIIVAGGISDQHYARARGIVDPVIRVGERVEGADRS